VKTTTFTALLNILLQQAMFVATNHVCCNKPLLLFLKVYVASVCLSLNKRAYCRSAQNEKWSDGKGRYTKKIYVAYELVHFKTAIYLFLLIFFIKMSKNRAPYFLDIFENCEIILKILGANILNLNLNIFFVITTWFF
jgi:hypothetical protein